jgi:type II secretory pathway component GspD/PulD (secretin)
MKKILLALTLLFSSCAFAGSELELNKVKLPEAISLIYSEVLKVPYMLDPQLVNDERMITFRLTPDIDERICNPLSWQYEHSNMDEKGC